MKKILLLIISSLGLIIYAQKGSYISFGIGPALLGNKAVLSSSNGALTGSYGEGFRFQTNGGYFFNDKLGIELTLDFLRGKPQNIFGEENTIKAHGKSKVYGMQLTPIFKIYKGLYIRGGLAMKIGGANYFTGQVKKNVPMAVFGVTKEDIKDLNISEIGTPTIPAWSALKDVQGKDGIIYLEDGAFQAYAAAKGTEEDRELDIQITRKNRGNPPFGIIAGMGYKHEIIKNLSIFAEVSYLGISVDANKSTIDNFKATYNGKKITKEDLFIVLERMDNLLNDKMPGSEGRSLLIGGIIDKRLDENKRNDLKAFKKLRPLLLEEVKFIDKPDTENPVNLKSAVSPYSSINLTFGFTYCFGNSNKK